MTTESMTNGVCPDCGADLPPQAVLCVSCGLNLKTGQKMASQLGGPQPGPPKKPPALRSRPAARPERRALVATLAALVVLLVLLGMGVLALRRGPSGGEGMGEASAADAGGADAWRAAHGASREEGIFRSELATVTGPQFVAEAFAERLAEEALLGILVEAIRGKQPPQPLHMTLALVETSAEQARLQFEVRYGGPGVALFEREFVGQPSGFPASVPGVSAAELGQAEAEDRAAEALLDSVPALLVGAAAALPRPSAALLGELEKWLKDGMAPERQQSACLYFASRPLRAKRTLPLLAELLGPVHPVEVRRAALGAVGAFGGEAADLLPLLGTLLDDPDPRVQSSARLAIAGIKTAQMGLDMVHADPAADSVAARREAAAREAEKRREERAIASLLEEFEKASRPPKNANRK